MPLDERSRSTRFFRLLIALAIVLPFIALRHLWLPHLATIQNMASVNTFTAESLRHRVLDIDDALVSEANPARNDGKLDVERCVRLHNYLVARGWMAKHEKGPEDLDELFNRPSYFEVKSDEAAEVNLRSKLDPNLATFLESTLYLGIPGQNDPSFFLWVGAIAAPSDMIDASKYFFDEEPEIDGKPHFLMLYITVAELGGHTMGVVYDQDRHQAAFPLVQEYNGYVSPVEDHKDAWFPLETILTHWINLVHLGKIVPEPIRSRNWTASLDVWSWKSYSAPQVDTAVAAFDRLTAAIESRMPSDSLLSVERESPLLTDAQLDAAAVPENCFVRSLLTRVKTPRFSTIAPGLEVPHDAALFASQQLFTTIPPGTGQFDDEHDKDAHEHKVPPVLLFASTDKTRPVRLGRDSTFSFFRILPKKEDSPWSPARLLSRYLKTDPPREEAFAPAGLYSEPTDRRNINDSEEGFKLLLPYTFRDDWGEVGPRTSDGELVERASSALLFQHGFLALGGEHRSQRLERLLDRWRELVEEGVWKVGPTGVKGTIDTYRDAQGSAWRHYWIPPDW